MIVAPFAVWYEKCLYSLTVTVRLNRHMSVGIICHSSVQQINRFNLLHCIRAIIDNTYIVHVAINNCSTLFLSACTVQLITIWTCKLLIYGTFFSSSHMWILWWLGSTRPSVRISPNRGARQWQFSLLNESYVSVLLNFLLWDFFLFKLYGSIFPHYSTLAFARFYSITSVNTHNILFIYIRIWRFVWRVSFGSLCSTIFQPLLIIRVLGFAIFIHIHIQHTYSHRYYKTRYFQLKENICRLFLWLRRYTFRQVVAFSYHSVWIKEVMYNENVNTGRVYYYYEWLGMMSEEKQVFVWTFHHFW